MKKRSPVCWMFGRIKRYIPALLLLTAVHIVFALFGVWFALGTKQIVDGAVNGNVVQFNKACIKQAAIIAGLILSLCLQRHLREWLLAELDRRWKQHLFGVLLHGEYAAVSAYHSGELMNRLNNDVRVMNEGMISALPRFADLVTRLVAALAVLIGLEPVFGLGIVGVGLLMLAVTALLRRKLKSLHKSVSEADGRTLGFLQETMEKLLLVQAMDAGKEMERRGDKLLQERFRTQRKRKNWALAANTGVSVFFYGAGFVALLWCASALLRGTMSFGELTAITQLVGQLRGPMVNISGIFPQYISMVAAAERLMELDSLSENKEPESLDMAAVYDTAEGIAAEGLSFSYDRDAVLCDAKFSLPKGAFAVITGASGVGKSTLLKLMLGIFKPESGRLYLKTKEETVALDRSTRRLFAYVPQGSFLFSGTLRDNLKMAKPKATEEELAQAVYVGAVDEYLQQLPEGLDTVLGENGAGLSEGQAQRLSIARAVLGGAPVLLLDEATSALDERTEQLVLERIRALPGRTCIAVTHRPAAMEVAEWKIEIKDRKIVMKHCGGEHE